MGPRIKWLVAAMVVVAAVASLLIKALFFPAHPIFVATMPTYYGRVACNDGYDLVIPGNTTIVLIYHVHGNLTINYASLEIDFPLSIINRTLSALSSVNPGNAMWFGVYLNGRLIAVGNYTNPVDALLYAVSQPYPYVYYNTTVNRYETIPNRTMTFWQFMKAENISVFHTAIIARLPTAINVRPGDTIALILYSAVPYALLVCSITSEAEEVQLMARYGWVGKPGTPLTAQQLIEAGQYITEVPTIYLMSKPPTAGSQEAISISGVKPYINNTAPIYALAYW
ncbi:hypothetical protein [Vulcanisaeta distributa]|nr:hypothetical protein [Vulcanisaeta distributa]